MEPESVQHTFIKPVASTKRGARSKGMLSKLATWSGNSRLVEARPNEALNILASLQRRWQVWIAKSLKEARSSWPASSENGAVADFTSSASMSISKKASFCLPRTGLWALSVLSLSKSAMDKDPLEKELLLKLFRLEMPSSTTSESSLSWRPTEFDRRGMGDTPSSAKGCRSVQSLARVLAETGCWRWQDMADMDQNQQR